jgi:hypothetical protein
MESELDDELLKLYIIIYGFTYNDIKNQLTQYNLINDRDGYLYCIKNSLYEIYDIEIFKLGNTLNLESRYCDYNNIYIDNIEIKKELYVPFKYTYEYLLFISLKNERIKLNREFFANYKKIDEEFKILENIINNKKSNNTEKLKKYLVHILNKFSIKNVMELKYNNEIQIKIINKKEIKYTIVPKKEKINAMYKKDKSGFIHLLKIEEIEHNFNNEIQYIFVSDKKCKKSMTEFLFPIKKKIKIVISNVYVAKILLKDMMNNKLIKNNYYECNEIFGINVITKIKEYFDNHKEEEIIKAYLYDMYGIGEKIMSSKFILTDKHKYGYSIKDIHKRMMEIIDDTDEEQEIITDDLKNMLNKKNIIVKKKSQKNKGIFIDTNY